MASSVFHGRSRQSSGDDIGVLRGVDQPGSVAFGADEEENPFARLPDAAVRLDLADQLPQDVNRRNIGPEKFQPG